MKRNETGSIGIQTLAVLAFCAAVSAASASLIMGAASAVKRASGKNASIPDKVLEAVESAIKALEADSDPECDSPLDPFYALESPEGFEIEVKEISSLANPNWIRKGLLDETSLKGKLLPGKNAQDLQQFREDEGLGATLAAFEDFFEKEYLSESMTVHSYANLDAADEFALRKLFAAATGDEGAAESFHGRLQKHLMSRERADEKKLGTLMGMDGTGAGRVMGIEPQHNVNFIAPELLQAIFSYPAFELKESSSRASMILAERSSKPLKPADLKRIVGKDAKHLIYAYLGTRSWFWSLKASSSDGRWEAVIARRLPETMDNALNETPQAVLVSLKRMPEETGGAP